jgi:translation elongation factor EF-Tu-like GTPase
MQGTFEVREVFEIGGRGIVVSGVVRSGIIRIGMLATLNGKEGKVSKIKAKNTLLTVGSEAGVLIEGLDAKDFSRSVLINFL